MYSDRYNSDIVYNINHVPNRAELVQGYDRVDKVLKGYGGYCAEFRNGCSRCKDCFNCPYPDCKISASEL